MEVPFQAEGDPYLVVEVPYLVVEVPFQVGEVSCPVVEVPFLQIVTVEASQYWAGEAFPELSLFVVDPFQV